MSDGNTPPTGGIAGSLSVQDAVRQLVAERKEPEQAAPQQRPTPPASPEPVDDAPDASDLETLEDSGEPEAPPPEQPRIRLSDGYEATLDEVAEWRRGQLREADYTRKTQELADQRRNMDAQWRQFQANTQQYAQAIDQAIAVVSHFMPPPPSDDLRKQDFFAWQEKKAEYDAQQDKLRALQHQRGEIQRAERAKRQQQQAYHLAQEQQKLLALRPELRDPAKVAKYTQDVQQFGVANGYSPQEVASVRDHRLFNIIDKAMKWDKFQASRAKLAEKAKAAQPMPPVQSPGRRASSAERQAAQIAPYQKAFDQSADAGRSSAVRDAARLLAAERAASLKR
jgi:hypothetical protein